MRILEATDFAFCLRFLQVAKHIVRHSGAEHLTEIASAGSTHPKHGFRLLVFVVRQNGRYHVDGAGASDTCFGTRVLLERPSWVRADFRALLARLWRADEVELDGSNGDLRRCLVDAIGAQIRDVTHASGLRKRSTERGVD